ncbi:MAG: PLP-dependent aminotransferase family protein, partial [Alphaproteobacteria bacterium]|nr:PLP-dependent aminotransferase family protein [Alphaproteobacteria bacterium]
MTSYRFAARCARMEAHSHPPSPPGAIRLSGGSAFAPTMPHVVKEAMAAAEEYRTETMQYGPLMGLADLRALLAEQERGQGTDVPPGHILVTNGAKQGIDLICRAFLDPGEPVIVSAPTYVTAVPIFVSNDATFVSIGQDADGLDVDALETTLAARARAGLPVPKLLYDIPDFHNPAGLTLSLERRRRLLDLAARHGFLIVEDQTYRQIRFAGEGLPSLRALDDGTHVIAVNTLSKLLAPGLRVGWVTAPPAILDRLAALKADGGTSPFLQRVAALVLARG